MKKITVFFLTFSILVPTFLFSCKPKGEDPAQVVQYRKLTGTWSIDSSQAGGAVTLSGTAQSGYDNFKLTFTGTEDAVSSSSSFNYAVVGRTFPSPWKASGTFMFDSSDPYTKLIRDSDSATDKVNVSYELSSDNSKLKISFNFSGSGYTAREENVGGNWIFYLKK